MTDILTDKTVARIRTALSRENAAEDARISANDRTQALSSLILEAVKCLEPFDAMAAEYKERGWHKEAAVDAFAHSLPSGDFLSITAGDFYALRSLLPKLREAVKP